MPKLKTHKGTAKRIKLTSTGKADSSSRIRWSLACKEK